MQKRIIDPPTFSPPEWPWSSLRFDSLDPDQIKGGPQEGASPAAGWALNPGARHQEAQGNNWTEMRSNGVGCKELPVHITKSYRKTCSCVPLEFIRKETQALSCNPLAHSRTHAKEMGLWHRLEQKPAAGILHDSHLSSYLSLKRPKRGMPWGVPAHVSLPWQVANVKWAPHPHTPENTTTEEQTSLA